MKEKSENVLITDVANYYSEKLKEHGSCPAGVDWNGEASQRIRFDQLSRIISPRIDSTFSVLDYGCGYGAYFDYLENAFVNFSYFGFDISREMIAEANKNLERNNNASVSDQLSLGQRYDYVVASGVFNVKLDHDDQEWQNYTYETLKKINELASKGFSFNCLTSFSDHGRMRPNLYYPSPTDVFNFCKHNFSKNVALLHDYNLYEFTILVRK